MSLLISFGSIFTRIKCLNYLVPDAQAHVYLNPPMVIWNSGQYSTLRIRSMRRTYRNGEVPQLAATI